MYQGPGLCSAHLDGRKRKWFPRGIAIVCNYVLIDYNLKCVFFFVVVMVALGFFAANCVIIFSIIFFIRSFGPSWRHT